MARKNGCLNSCLEVILELPKGNLDDAPVVGDAKRGDVEDVHNYHDALNAYIMQRFGLQIVRLPISTQYAAYLEQALSFPSNFIPNGVKWILVGFTNSGKAHAVVVENGKIITKTGPKIKTPSWMVLREQTYKAWFYYFLVPSRAALDALTLQSPSSSGEEENDG